MANFQSAGNTAYEKAEDWKNTNCESRGRACDIEYVANVQKEGDDAARLIADFVPLLGDVKGFIEAEDGVDILLAVAGIIPGVSESKAIVKLNKAADGLGSARNSGDELIDKINAPDNTSEIGGDVCVYSCVDADGITRYVGITNDVKRRGQAHLLEKKRGWYRLAGMLV